MDSARLSAVKSSPMMETINMVSVLDSEGFRCVRCGLGEEWGLKLEVFFIEYLFRVHFVITSPPSFSCTDFSHPVTATWSLYQL